MNEQKTKVIVDLMKRQMAVSAEAASILLNADKVIYTWRLNRNPDGVNHTWTHDLDFVFTVPPEIDSPPPEPRRRVSPEEIEAMRQAEAERLAEQDACEHEFPTDDDPLPADVCVNCGYRAGEGESDV